MENNTEEGMLSAIANIAKSVATAVAGVAVGIFASTKSLSSRAVGTMLALVVILSHLSIHAWPAAAWIVNIYIAASIALVIYVGFVIYSFRHTLLDLFNAEPKTLP